MATESNPASFGAKKFARYGMIVCCTVMLIPVAGYFLAGGTLAGLWSNFAVFAPIALCLGAHGLVFKMMGKSCHGEADEVAQLEPTKVPKVAKRVIQPS